MERQRVVIFHVLVVLDIVKLGGWLRFLLGKTKNKKSSIDVPKGAKT
jgi:hypothetical protein